MSFEFDPIAHLETPFDEKFGVPRQPGLIPEAIGRVRFCSGYDDPLALSGLEGFSHLWLVFVFHLIDEPKKFRATVRPPRLGGEARQGVFATRSGFRPNRIGLSLVTIENLDLATGLLELGGVDLVNGTPILDLKPYLPWVESVPNARSGFAPDAPASTIMVEFSKPALDELRRLRPNTLDLDEPLLRQVVAQDPRPAWDRKRGDPQQFAARLLGLDLRWEVIGSRATITQIVEEEPEANQENSKC